MLKTNSKKARVNIRAYIMNNFTPENHTETPPQDFSEIAAFILDVFRRGNYSSAEDFRYYHNNERIAFADWCAGLPSVLDCCYFYNRSAVDDLGAILEETEEEKAKYTEEQAEERLTWCIYKELKEGAVEQPLTAYIYIRKGSAKE